MKIQHTFQRYEKKFLLTGGQYDELMRHLGQWMVEDEYGLHTICNIYYDTDTYDLVRASIERPPYKEKFRLRSYGILSEDGMLFAEIKKKFDGVVYKRRVLARPHEIQEFLNGASLPDEDRQIQREIQWFLHTHSLSPKVFIGYERRAYTGREDSGIRITFDRDIRWRTEDLDLRVRTEGSPVLDDGNIVMEVKLPRAAPLWLAGLLSGLHIYSVSFSKYGTCYQKYLAKNIFLERTMTLC